MVVWRLLPLLTAAGEVQMAIDTWLLEQHRLGLQPPTLRFYTWSPVAISLGYHQPCVPDAWRTVTWQGQAIDLVRRPSGGRAVLHQGDLTYAVITSGIAGTRMQAYQTLCEFLIQGWRRLGVELHYGQAGRGYQHNPNCFGTATIADLVLADGTKLIGSAQLRRDSAILQHGSMRLEPDATLFTHVFGVETLPLPQVPLPLTGVDLQQTVMAALIAAARQCFDIELALQPLEDSEWQAIQRQVPSSSKFSVKL